MYFNFHISFSIIICFWSSTFAISPYSACFGWLSVGSVKIYFLLKLRRSVIKIFHIFLPWVSIWPQAIQSIFVLSVILLEIHAHSSWIEELDSFEDCSESAHKSPQNYVQDPWWCWLNRPVVKMRSYCMNILWHEEYCYPSYIYK